MKQVFNVKIEVDAALLPTADTVDYELGRLASALSLFANEYLITMEGAADGTWHGFFVAPHQLADAEEVEEW